MFKQSGVLLYIWLAICVVLAPVLGFNGPNFAAARAGRSLTMGGPPPVVILPGFGNAQEDYIDPYNGQLGDEASFVSSLRKRGPSWGSQQTGIDHVIIVTCRNPRGLVSASETPIVFRRSFSIRC
jgi:hypothetical protein